MQRRSTSPGELSLDTARDCAEVSRSPFAEECHLRVRGTDSAYSILDYRAPAGFGPARHTHRFDDEIIHLLEGRIVIWTPERCFTMTNGDMTLLPKRMPHTWRAFGNEGVHFTVTVVPGGFERFFSLTEQRGVTTTDHDGLGAAAREAGVDPIGPPLSDDEVVQIVAGKTRLDGHAGSPGA